MITDNEFSNKVVSYFVSVFSKKPIETAIAEVFEEIKNCKHRLLIDEIRKTDDKKERSLLKNRLPAITVSGQFINGHRAEDLVKHSGLIQIDIDEVDNFELSKQNLYKDTFTFIGFESPSRGIKLIVKIPPDPETHLASFKALEAYYLSTYSLRIDPACKDVNRLMYLSADKNAYINENAAIFNHRVNLPQPRTSKNEKVDSAQVEEIIRQTEAKQIDITGGYDEWIKLGFAIADQFGEEGREYFQRISRFHPDYSAGECNKQFDKCLRDFNGQKITIKTFFKIAAKNKIYQSKDKTPLVNYEFYHVILDKDGNYKDVTIKYKQLSDLLYSFGIMRYDIGRDYVYILKKDQIIDEIPEHKIMDIFTTYLKKLPDDLGNGLTREKLIEKFYRNPSNYICDNRLKLLKPNIPIVFNKDSQSECYVYYKNGFVKCSENGYNLFNYYDLDGYIWKNQIIDRDFQKTDLNDKNIENLGSFGQFIYRIASNDRERFKSICTIIGYNIHNNFDGKLKATILNDSKISDNPEGRTGKTLISKALGHVRRYHEINGKDFDSADKFKYQQLELDTQIVCYNDVKSKFDFESLFNDITEGISINKKRQDAFKIRAKIIVTTNRTLNILGGSAKDRAIEFELSDHFSKDYTPKDEFNHWFFTDWEKPELNNEWVLFDNFMIHCVSLYLKSGIIESKAINLEKRRVRDQTNIEFAEFIEDKVGSGEIKLNTEYLKKDLHEMFLNEYDELKDEKYFKTQANFTKWLNIWALSHNYKVENRKSGKDRYIKFTE